MISNFDGIGSAASKPSFSLHPHPPNFIHPRMPAGAGWRGHASSARPTLHCKSSKHTYRKKREALPQRSVIACEESKIPWTSDTKDLAPPRRENRERKCRLNFEEYFFLDHGTLTSSRKTRMITITPALKLENAIWVYFNFAIALLMGVSLSTLSCFEKWPP